MTSPRATYGGGYYTAPSFPDTPIYDSLVAERGTPQIAPIRVPSAYDTGNSYLPALPSSLPALPPAPSAPAPAYGGYQQQPMPLQHAPAPYIPQQAPPRGYPAQQQQPAAYQQPYQQQPQRPMPVQGNGYDTMRPAAAQRPQPAPPVQQYDDPYNRPYQSRGY